MKKAFLTIAAMLIGSPLLADAIDVMSFNIRGDFDGGVATTKGEGWIRQDGTNRRDLVLHLVENAKPDVLGVQEAYRNQVQELDAALPGHSFYGVGREDGIEEGEHCVIFYRRERFQLVDAGTFWLSESPLKPSLYPGAACKRIASWVVLDDQQGTFGELVVVNTHWDHVSESARHFSGGLIAQRLPSLSEGRSVIVLGDLNAGEASVAVTKLVNGPVRLTDSFRTVVPTRGMDERTFHGFKGGTEGGRIDFVFHSDGLQATAADINRVAFEGVFPSDHYPVTARLAPRAVPTESE